MTVREHAWQNQMHVASESPPHQPASNPTPVEQDAMDAPTESSSDASPDDSPDSATEDPSSITNQGYELPLDQIFEILKNSRRRQTLRFLYENDGETTLSEVAEHIAALENDTTVQAISSAQRKRVYVGLYQCHLPKMDDTDVIDFEQNRGTIEFGPNIAQLEPYLDEPKQREWYKMYFSVAVGGFALFLAAQAGAAAYGLTSTAVLLVLLVGITACVALQYLSKER